jgi:hypothetical protein
MKLADAREIVTSAQIDPAFCRGAGFSGLIVLGDGGGHLRRGGLRPVSPAAQGGVMFRVAVVP